MSTAPTALPVAATPKSAALQQVCPHCQKSGFLRIKSHIAMAHTPRQKETVDTVYSPKDALRDRIIFCPHCGDEVGSTNIRREQSGRPAAPYCSGCGASLIVYYSALKLSKKSYTKEVVA
jgi:hypothetical protein